jgi:hypothetical protein
VFDDMAEGLHDVDVVMMLRLQKERMDGGFIPSEREYYHRFGLDAEKLAHAKPDAIVMHPGPMNRGVEIDGTLADDINALGDPGDLRSRWAWRRAHGRPGGWTSVWLRDGLGVDEGDIGADAARLDSVTGHIAVITSAAFGRRPQTLTPRAPLRHLGTYREAGAGVTFAPLPAASAQGEAIGTPGGPRAATAMPRLPLYLVAAIILLALLVTVLLGFGGAGE